MGIDFATLASDMKAGSIQTASASNRDSFLKLIVGDNYIKIVPWMGAGNQVKYFRPKFTHFYLPFSHWKKSKEEREKENNIGRICIEKSYPEFNFTCPLCKVLKHVASFRTDVKAYPTTAYEMNVLTFTQIKDKLYQKDESTKILSLTGTVFDSILKTVSNPAIGPVGVLSDKSGVFKIVRPENFQGKKTYVTTFISPSEATYADPQGVCTACDNVKDLDLQYTSKPPTADFINETVEIAKVMYRLYAEELEKTGNILSMDIGGEPVATPPTTKSISYPTGGAVAIAPPASVIVPTISVSVPPPATPLMPTPRAGVPETSITPPAPPAPPSSVEPPAPPTVRNRDFYMFKDGGVLPIKESELAAMKDCQNLQVREAGDAGAWVKWQDIFGTATVTI